MNEVKVSPVEKTFDLWIKFLGLPIIFANLTAAIIAGMSYGIIHQILIFDLITGLFSRELQSWWYNTTGDISAAIAVAIYHITYLGMASDTLLKKMPNGKMLSLIVGAAFCEFVSFLLRIFILMPIYVKDNSARDTYYVILQILTIVSGLYLLKHYSDLKEMKRESVEQ